MSKPTLLLRGNLKYHKHDKAIQEDLDTYVPRDYILKWFKDREQLVGINNRVLILKSMTASGKSTALPPEIYTKFIHNGRQSDPGMICTQPRRITAIKNIKAMLPYNSNLRVGINAGWSTEYDKVLPLVNNCFLSATLQTLTQQLKSMTDEELRKKYKFILIDECHERSMALDLTLYMLKNFILRNLNKLDCPFVVCMSATFDEDVYLRYFGLSKDTNFIWCLGFSNPKREIVMFDDTKVSKDLNKDIVAAIEMIIENGDADEVGKRDIIVFLPNSENEALHAMLDLLNAKLAKTDHKNVMSIIQISSTAQENQTREFLYLDDIPLSSQIQEINGKKYVPSRRLILSTNVAETGLTLEELKYVVDAGFNNDLEFDPILGLLALYKKPAAQSRIEQRIGRVGRKFPGVYIRMYSARIYESLPKQQYPDILVSDVTAILLDIFVEQLKAREKSNEELVLDVMRLDVLTAPSIDSLMYSLERLWALGLISTNGITWNSDFELMIETAEQTSVGVNTKPASELTMSTEQTSVGVNTKPASELTMTAEQTSVGVNDKPVMKTAEQKALQLTLLGVLSARLLSPYLQTVENVRMILAGYTWNASILDLITVAVYLQADKKMKSTIKWEVVYKSGLNLNIKNDKAYYSIKSIVNDQFIEGIILFDSFMHAIDNNAIEKWYDLVGVNKTLFIKQFLRVRDAAIEHMLCREFRVFDVGVSLASARNEMEFIDLIGALKHCIYDGYRLNCAIYNEATLKYDTRAIAVGDPNYLTLDKKRMSELGIKSDYIVKPKYVVYDKLDLMRLKPGELAQKVRLGAISVLDNYVGVDTTFII